MSSAVFTFMAQQNGNFSDIARFDSAGNGDVYNVGIGGNTVYPGVYTFMLDGVTGFAQRLNGAPYGTPTLPSPFQSGTLAAQDAVGIGGQTDQDAALFPNGDFCGIVGVSLLFKGILDPISLAFWENYALSASNIAHA